MYNDFWYNVLNNVDNKDSFPIDVIAKDNMYEVYANLPGFSKDEISLNFDGGYLNISAKHKAVENKEHINYVIKERSLRAKKRSIYFGDLNEDHISAKLSDGVLVVSIYLKKPEDKRVSTISIE